MDLEYDGLLQDAYAAVIAGDLEFQDSSLSPEFLTELTEMLRICIYDGDIVDSRFSSIFDTLYTAKFDLQSSLLRDQQLFDSYALQIKRENVEAPEIAFVSNRIDQGQRRV